MIYDLLTYVFYLHKGHLLGAELDITLPQAIQYLAGRDAHQTIGHEPSEGVFLGRSWHRDYNKAESNAVVFSRGKRLALNRAVILHHTMSFCATLLVRTAAEAGWRSCV